MIAIIPRPAELDVLPGRCVLSTAARVDGDGDAADLLRPWLTDAIATAPVAGASRVRLVADPACGDVANEGYRLTIDRDGILATARDQRGLRHAAQVLRQLFAAHLHDLPCLRITDRPRFAWRGVHLDVSRHFFPVDDVCRLIDLAALHRMSVFHWHLTDDQGWRIEIRSRPRLTTIGAIRPESKIGHFADESQGYDGTPHGGSYSQADIRRVVAHAARLGITVLPEIDLPGHMQAAICAYPELGNGLAEPRIRTTWGISHQILNCEPATFRFVEDVLSEVLDLFPSPWIHLGGDEVPIDEWQASPAARARATALGCANVEGLQHHWTTHCAAWLAARGRRLIGWDEIHERSGAALPAGTAVMAWRGEQHGIAAAQAGFDVVMGPGFPTYLDHYQVLETERAREPLAIGGRHRLEDCAAWEPLPATLAGTPAAARILGGQCQLWSEYIADRAKLDYQAFPRLCAIAEALWTPMAQRTWPDFRARIEVHQHLLARLGVRYRPLTAGGAP